MRLRVMVMGIEMFGCCRDRGGKSCADSGSSEPDRGEPSRVARTGQLRLLLFHSGG